MPDDKDDGFLGNVEKVERLVIRPVDEYEEEFEGTFGSFRRRGRDGEDDEEGMYGEDGGADEELGSLDGGTPEVRTIHGLVDEMLEEVIARDLESDNTVEEESTCRSECERMSNRRLKFIG